MTAVTMGMEMGQREVTGAGAGAAAKPGAGTTGAFPVEAVLEAARFAPSAHNAQPWRLVAGADGALRVRYAYADKLQADPDDRDGLLALGAFVETVALAAQARGWATDVEPHVRYRPDGIELGTLRPRPLEPGEAVDPLARYVGERRTNRHPYDGRPLPDELAAALRALGCVLVEPGRVEGLAERASVMAWQDARFVRDLAAWTRFREGVPDGMSPACLTLSPLEQAGVRAAFALDRLPRALARAYARWDVRLVRSSTAVAVMAVPDRAPLTLVACGRRLLRAWVEVARASYSCHPISVVIDQPTAAELARDLGLAHPVAIFRVGHATQPAAPSARRPVSALLLQDPPDQRRP